MHICEQIKTKFSSDISYTLLQINNDDGSIQSLYYLSLVVGKQVFGVSDQSDTNRSVHTQKMTRGLKFRMQEVELLYYRCSENKGPDQLHAYREADLRLCFRICKKPVFS